MNIFFLDESPILAAQAQHDRHIVKMTLETCQLLSTAVWAREDWKSLYESVSFLREGIDDKFSGSFDLYKSTHLNHPSSIWTRESEHNFVWLTIHLCALLSEYHRRFPGKTHACDRLKFIFAAISGKMMNHGFLDREGQVSQATHNFALEHTPFVYCGPDRFANYYGVEDENQHNLATRFAYQSYYLHEKLPNNRWTNPIYKPKWLIIGQPSFHYPVTQKWIKPKVVGPERTVESMSNPTKVKMPARFGRSNQ